MNGDNLNFEHDENINNNELYQFSNNIRKKYIKEVDKESDKNYEEEKNIEKLEENNGDDLNLNLNSNINNNNFQDNNIQSNFSNIEKISLNNSTYNNSFLSRRLRPNLIRLINQVFHDEVLYSILNYLDLIELSQFRSLDRTILLIVHEYYKKRVKIEIDNITKYQDNNREKMEIFMKNIDSQIPLSNKGWLDFDLKSVSNKLLILDRNLLTKLRSIKNIGKTTDLIYAPFCIIFGLNKVNNKNLKNLSWKQIASKIFNDPNIVLKIQNLDLENMEDSEMLETFVFLNLPELEINNVKYFSSDFSNLILWCQGVVSYHILIHPYNYRNDHGVIQPDSEIYLFAKNMKERLDKFYRFKRFLFSLNIMKIPLADYVFNLQHTREAIDISNNLDISNSYFNDLDSNMIGNILSYIPYKQSFKLMQVSKKFCKGFLTSIDIVIFNIIKEIYFFRYQSYEKLINKIPLLYSHNIFSKFFLMIDDILNSKTRNKNEFGSSFYPFLSKEHISHLKTLKVKNINVHKISKIFCLICDVKPIKKINKKNGDLMLNYVDVVKSLAIKGELCKFLRDVNKLYFNQKKISQIDNELKEYYNLKKLKEIKNINHGIYQLLIWELFVLQYLKVYNIFDFLDINYINNIYDHKEIESIKYYIEIMDYLKYNLKIKYHFSNTNLLNNENSNNKISP